MKSYKKIGELRFDGTKKRRSDCFFAPDYGFICPSETSTNGVWTNFRKFVLNACNPLEIAQKQKELKNENYNVQFFSETGELVEYGLLEKYLDRTHLAVSLPKEPTSTKK
jgi:hypothetical protein